VRTIEYDRDTDPKAAEFVFARTELGIWQFPLETYRRCAYSVGELEHHLAGSDRVGRWLWERFLELPLPEWVQLGSRWLVVRDTARRLRTARGRSRA
jgi:purine nucleosidase